jgi:UDP-glucose 4-epimerase
LKAKRSVLSVENLNAAIALALIEPRSRGETFIVADPTPVAVADLVERYRVGFGRPARLFSVPDRIFQLTLNATGQTAIWHRIGCPLVARPEKLLALGWKPS